MSEVFRIAAVQMCSGVAPDDNVAALGEYVGAAVAQGATYVLTPEVTLAFAGDRAALSAVAGQFEGNAAIAACGEIAKKSGVHLHIGSAAIAFENGKFANRSLLFAPDGTLVAQYDKIHLFDADPPHDRPYRESATYEAGTQAIVTDAPGFKLGMSICYDMRFPALYNALAGAGAEVLAVPAAFTVPTGKAHWEVLLRARAIETGSYVIAAAQGGAHENERATWGHSMIIDPWGAIVAEKNDDQPGIILAEIDLIQVAEARGRVPALANARPFSLSVNFDLS